MITAVALFVLVLGVHGADVLFLDTDQVVVDSSVRVFAAQTSSSPSSPPLLPPALPNNTLSRHRRAYPPCRGPTCDAGNYCYQSGICVPCVYCDYLGVSSSYPGGNCAQECSSEDLLLTVTGSPTSLLTGATQALSWTTPKTNYAVNLFLKPKPGSGRSRVTIITNIKPLDATSQSGYYSWQIPHSTAVGDYQICAEGTLDTSTVACYPESSYIALSSGACRAHSGCASGYYCDTSGACAECDSCFRYRDGVGGTCPSSCDGHTDRVSTIKPLQDDLFSTGTDLVLEWKAGDNAPSTLRFHLLAGGSTSIKLRIAENVDSSLGTLTWKVPVSVSTGNYWIAITPQSTLTVLGHMPSLTVDSQGLGSRTFKIEHLTCNAHSDCEKRDAYCDTNSNCWPCDQCYAANDGFDGTCPSWCNGADIDVGDTLPPNTDEKDASGSVRDFVIPGCPSYDELVVNNNEDIVFDPTSSTKDPHRMTLRLSRKLDLLATAVKATFPNTKLRVISAYEDKPADISLASLHNEGRAVTLSLDNSVTEERLSILAGLAANVAGFDWVKFVNANYIYASVIPDGCTKPVDLVFLLDGSGSIEMPEYGGATGNFANQVLPFVKEMISYFNIGDSQTRVGVAVFSTSVSVAFHLKTYKSKTSILAAVDNISYPRGGTSTSLGIEAVRTQMFTAANGMRDQANGVARVCVVLTDGQANDGFQPAAEAKLLRDSLNVNVFSIGVGSYVNTAELESMATEPANVFSVKSFNSIQNIVDDISASTCAAPTILKLGTQTITTIANCETKYFKPVCAELSNFVLKLRTVSGNVHLYASASTQTPGPFDHEAKVENNDPVKTIIFSRTSNDPIFIAVLGAFTGGPSSFTLDVSSDIFNGVASATTATIPENSNVPFSPVYTPPAVQDSKLSPTFTFSADSEHGKDFTINANTGVITLVRPLDRETKDKYTLQIRALDAAFPCLVGDISVTVPVGDENDNGPTFTSVSYAASIPETIGGAVKVLIVEASDADVGSNGQFEFSMAATNPANTPFTIDATSGEISTQNNPAFTFNAETQNKFSFTVRVKDKGNPALSSVAVCTITVTPVECRAGTFSPTGTAPCASCSSGSFAASSGARSCSPCGCKANTYASGVCSATSNYVCTSCPANSESTAPDASDPTVGVSACVCKTGYYGVTNPSGLDPNRVQCLACGGTCPTGYFESAKCSSTANRVCTPCTDSCPRGEYLVGQCGGTKNPTCNTCDECVAEENQFELRPCTVDGNRVCGDCTSECPSGQYLFGTCGGASQPVCRTCTTQCLGDQYLVGKCGGSNNPSCTSCRTCTNTQYETAPCDGARQNRECSDCTLECPSGEYLVGTCGQPGSQQDNECQTCTNECEDGQYLTGKCGGRTNRECRDCHPTCSTCSGAGSDKCESCVVPYHLNDKGECVRDCGANFYQHVDPETEEGTCRPCDTKCTECQGPTANECEACAANYFLVTIVPGQPGICREDCPHKTYEDEANRVCAACRTCPPGSFPTGGCDGEVDTVCTSYTVCTPDVEFEIIAPTSSSNRVCQRCTTSCDAGQELTGTCAGNQDKTCKPCGLGTYKLTAGSGTCQPCTLECKPTHHLSGLCSATSTPTCEPCTSSCSAGSYLVGECGGETGYSTTRCQTCRVCEDGLEFEISPCGGEAGKTNRQCESCTSRCGQGQYLVGECGGTSNPTCQKCATECDAGFYLSGTCGGRQTTTCKECHEDCATCFGGGNDQCRSCPADTYLLGTRCVTDCGNNHYEQDADPQVTGDSSTCEPCHVNCNNCDGAGPGSCTSCPTGLFLQDGFCVEVCTDSVEFANSATRACEACRTCPSGQYKTGGCDGVADTTCKPWTQCEEDATYEVLSPTALRDRQCAPCTLTCGVGEELIGECSGTSNPQCSKCRTGKYKDTKGPEACEPCTSDCEGEDAYLAGSCTETTTPFCVMCTEECPAGEYLSGTCTLASDRTCKTCTRCEEGQYQSRSCSSDHDRTCANCVQTCPADQYLTGSCGPANDPTASTSCQDCTTEEDCDSNQYLEGECNTAQDPRANPTCQDCDKTCATCDGGSSTDCTSCNAPLALNDQGECVDECEAHEFIDTEANECKDCPETCERCSGPGDDDCTSCPPEKAYLTRSGTCEKECPKGEFGNQFGRCQTCRTCPLGFYDSGAGCEGVTDTTCKPWTVCTPGQQYEIQAPSATADRQCKTCTSSCVAGYELSGECAGTSDRSCQPCPRPTHFKASAGSQKCSLCKSSCVPGYYLTGVCTSTTSPRCQPCKDNCDAEDAEMGVTHYLDGDCGGRANPVCKPCDTCSAGHYETGPCSIEGNRECKPCTSTDDCDNTEYLKGECTVTSNPKCTRCTTAAECDIGEYLEGECTKTNNPTCQTCTVCAKDEYQVEPCTATSDRKCAKCTDSCPFGQYLFGSCSGPSFYTLTINHGGATYALLDGADPLSVQASCRGEPSSVPDGWQLAPDTPETRSLIASHPWGAKCVATSAGAAYRTNLQGDALAEFPDCDACGDDVGQKPCFFKLIGREGGDFGDEGGDFGGEGDLSSGTIFPFGCGFKVLVVQYPPRCRTCTTECDETHYLTGQCQGAENPICQACDTCTSDEYEVTPCSRTGTGRQNRECATCTKEEDCEAGFFLTGQCQGSENPECTKCTSKDQCSAETHLTGQCGGRSDHSCKQCRQCQHGLEFETVPCNVAIPGSPLGGDRQCATCTTVSDCETGVEYLDGECTGTNNPTCKPCVHQCPTRQYLSGVCAGRENPTCEPCHGSCLTCEGDGAADSCTSCPAGTFLKLEPGELTGTCVSTCPGTNEFADQKTGQCRPCNITCFGCSGPGANECKGCPQGKFLTSENTCVEGCPLGSFGNTDAGTCDGCRRCTPGHYASGGCSGTTNTICTEWTRCTAGEQQALPPTITNDRECEPCPPGTFQPSPDQLSCIPVTQCPNSKGLYEKVAPTETSDRTCGSVTKCQSGKEFLSEPATATSDAVCQTLTQCLETQYISTLPTLTSDRACTPYTGCELEIEYISVPATDFSDRTCTTLTECDYSTQYASVQPTRFSDRVCTTLTVCDKETQYQTVEPTNNRDRQCADLLKCNVETQYESVAPTATSNRQCAPLTDCGRVDVGYETVAPTPTTDRQCASVTSCTASEYQTKAPTRVSDRECTNKTVCLEKQYQTFAGSLTADRTCEDCTPCPAEGHYQISGCTSTANFVCNECSSCPSSHWREEVCTSTTDTLCTPCTEACPPRHFISRKCGVANNLECQGCQVCNFPAEYTKTTCGIRSDTVCETTSECDFTKQYMLDDVTPSSDRICRDLTACVTDKQFISVPKTQTSDRKCQQLTECLFDEGLQYETVSPTASSDRQCGRLTQCVLGQTFQSVAPTVTSNRQCSPLTVCDVGQEQTQAPSLIQNRECRTCPAGSTDRDSNPITVCVDCPVGSSSKPGHSGACNVCPPGTADEDEDPATPCDTCDGVETFQPAEGQSECLEITTCQAGEEEELAPTRFQNRQCRSCVLGQSFKRKAGQSTTCKPVTTCQAGFEQSRPPTTSSDRACRACPEGTFKPNAGNVAKCQPWTVCAPGFEETEQPSSSADRVCTACQLGTTFKELSGQSSQCVSVTQCDLNSQFITARPTTSTDRQCQSLTTCQVTQFQSVPKTDFTDRKCADCTVCPEVTDVECSAEADAQCSDCSTCVAGETFIDTPCAEGDDVVCASCTICDLNSQFIESPCVVEQDTVCKTLTTCDAKTEYEDTPKTDSSDRSCTALVECNLDTHFVSVEATPTSQRQCQLLTVCGEGQEQSVAPTRTSDRQCRDCPAGFFDHDAEGDTACQECPTGTHTEGGAIEACDLCTPGSVDADNDPATECTACPTGQFQPARGKTTCDPWTVCGPGSHILSAGSKTANVVCEECQVGVTFNSVGNNSDCLKVTECNLDTHYESDGPTLISDTVCTTLTACDFSQQYESGPPSRFSDRVCSTLTSCAAGEEFESQAKTVTSDRICDTATVCTENQFEVSPLTSVADRVCQDHTKCVVDKQYQVQAPTGSSDRVCRSLTQCDFGSQFMSTAHTSTSDRVCTNLTACSANEFEEIPAAQDRDRTCATCATCPNGHFVLEACAPTNNTVCSGCTTCASGFFVQTACQPEDDTDCQACSQCVAGETYAHAPCAGSDDTDCRACSSCDGDHFIKDICTPSSNTVCQALTECNFPAEFESERPGLLKDRVCQNVTRCRDGEEYEETEPTEGSDRVCQPFTQCDLTTHFIKVKATPTADRICHALTECDLETQFISTRKTDFTDRVCTNLRTCDFANEYQSTAPTAFSNRVCTQLLQCTVDEYESQRPTRTSNRVCTAQPLPRVPPEVEIDVFGEVLKGESNNDIHVGLLVSAVSGGHIQARVGSVVSEPHGISVEVQRSASVKCMALVASPLYPSQRELRFACQVRDAQFQAQVQPTQVTVWAVPPAGSDPEQFSEVFGRCTTETFVDENDEETPSSSSPPGTCVATVELPKHWFTGDIASLSIQYAVEGSQNSARQTLGATDSFVLKPKPRYSVLNNVVIEMPQRSILPGETFAVDVLANAGLSITSFSLKFESSDNIKVKSIKTDASIWRAFVQPGGEGLEDMAVTGILADPTSITEGQTLDATVLCSLQLQVPPNAEVGNASLTGSVFYLGNARGQQVMPSNGSPNAPVTFVDRFGTANLGTGKVFVAQPVVTGVLASSERAQLVNFAMLGDLDFPSSSPLTVMVGFSDGVMVFPNDADDEDEGGEEEKGEGEFEIEGPSNTNPRLFSLECVSSSKQVIQADRNCRAVYFDGSEVESSADVPVEVTVSGPSGGAAYALPLRVWTPNVEKLEFTVSDDKLSAVRDWFSEDEDCRQLYQAASVSIQVPLKAGENLQTRPVDMTGFLGSQLDTPQTNILQIHEVETAGEELMVQGLSPGAATVRLLLPVFDEEVGEPVMTPVISVNVTVDDEQVLVTRLDCVVVSSVSFDESGADLAHSVPPIPATLTPGGTFSSRLSRENQVGQVVCRAVTSDAQRMPVSRRMGVQLLSLDSTRVGIASSGLGVIAKGTGSGPLVRAIWSSGGECSSFNVAENTVDVSISLRVPQSVVLTLSSTTMAPSSSSPVTNAPMSIPAAVAVSVTQVFADGSRVDITSDLRLAIEEATETLDLVAGNGGLFLEVGQGQEVSGGDEFVIKATFTDGALQLSAQATITIIDVDAAAVVLRPFPSFVGSDSMTVSTLAAYSTSVVDTTPFYQQGQLVFLATLSSGTVVDITSETSFSLSVPSSVVALDGSVVEPLANAASVTATASVFGGALTAQTTFAVDSATRVLVTALSNLRLRPVGPSSSSSSSSSSSTVSAVKGTQFQVFYDVTFDDNTRREAESSTVPGLVIFASSATLALPIDGNKGVVVLNGNLPSSDSARITVTATSGSANPLSSDFACNLLPAVTDVDLGGFVGAPIASQIGGSSFNVPVRVNVGQANTLKTLRVLFTFPSSLLSVKGILTSGAWDGGAFTRFIDNEAGEFGFLAVPNDPSGLQGVVEIATVQFKVADENAGTTNPFPAVANITGVVLDFLNAQDAPLIQAQQAVVAGEVQIALASSPLRRRRRSSEAVEADENLSTSSATFSNHMLVRRATACASPPCAVCVEPRQTGDANGDCVFDVVDITYLQTILAQRMFDPTFGSTFLLSDQLDSLDSDGNGIIDPRDSDFLNRALAGLVRFVKGLDMELVSLASGCRLELTLSVLKAGDVPATGSDTFVYFDVESNSPGFGADFDTTVFDPNMGSRVTSVDKGAGFSGGLWAAVDVGSGKFGVRLATMIDEDFDIGLSVIQAVAVSSPTPADARSLTMFGNPNPPFEFANSLDITLPLPDSTSVQITSPNGYTAWRDLPNAQNSLECHEEAVECDADQYESVAATLTSDRECATISVCDFSTQFQQSDFTEISDRVCVDFTECTSGEQWEFAAPTNFADRICKDITDCDTATQFIATAATSVSDNVCQTLTVCGSNEYQSTAPTSTSDRGCSTVSECKSNEVLEVPATAISDNVCVAVDFCGSNPCKNGGVCSSTATGWTCDCTGTDHVGNDCSIPDYCNANGGDNCQNGAICVSTVEGATCVCSPGFCGACCTFPDHVFCPLGDVCVDGGSIVVGDGDSEAASGSGSENSNAGAIAGGVLGGLILLVLIIILIMFLARRQWRKKKEADVEGMVMPTFSDEFAENIGYGQIDPNDPMYLNFRRVVAFDFLRYNHVILALSDKSLQVVYKLLFLPGPDQAFFMPMREQLRAFLDHPLVHEPQEDEVSDVVDFIERALPDVLVEIAIDYAARTNGSNEEEDIYEGFYAAIDDGGFTYETPVGLQDATYEAIGNGRGKGTTEYYDVGTNAEPLYALGESGEPLYAMGDGGKDAIYSMGDQDGNDPIYSMGNRDGNESPTYALGTEPQLDDDPIYALGEESEDNNGGYIKVGDQEEPVYDMGTGKDDPTYSMARELGLEDSKDESPYFMANPMQGKQRGSDLKEGDYALASDMGLNNDDDDEADPDYQLANNLGIGLSRSERRKNKKESPYQLASDMGLEDETEDSPYQLASDMGLENSTSQGNNRTGTPQESPYMLATDLNQEADTDSAYVLAAPVKDDEDEPDYALASMVDGNKDENPYSMANPVVNGDPDYDLANNLGVQTNDHEPVYSKTLKRGKLGGDDDDDDDESGPVYDNQAFEV
eukprot:m.214394 g.214394  ORF g.214394 m.214394 type:complete len:6684 (-) comp26186_c0_seq6:25-20076(-)